MVSYGLQTVYNGQTEPFFSDVMVIGHPQTVVDYGWPHSPPTCFFCRQGVASPSPNDSEIKSAVWRLESMMGMLVEFLASFKYLKLRHEVGLSENRVNLPNEIAIFHRDNDQQNHWV